MSQESLLPASWSQRRRSFPAIYRGYPASGESRTTSPFRQPDQQTGRRDSLSDWAVFMRFIFHCHSLLATNQLRHCQQATVRCTTPSTSNPNSSPVETCRSQDWAGGDESNLDSTGSDKCGQVVHRANDMGQIVPRMKPSYGERRGAVGALGQGEITSCAAGSWPTGHSARSRTSSRRRTLPKPAPCAKATALDPKSSPAA